MKSMKTVFGLICGLLLVFEARAYTTPDPELTPGVVCTTSDPDFRGLDYPERIARCNRNVNYQQKLQIAKTYGDIPQADWPNYEFDHLIPLCAGGSNSSKNIWPQPIDQAKKKDVLENDICLAMRAGTLTQAAAIQKVKDWFDALRKTQQPQPQEPQQPSSEPGTEPGAVESSEQLIYEKAFQILSE